MPETIVAKPEPRKIHRFRCLKCGRIFDTYNKTPSCCGNLQKLVIPPPTKIVKVRKKAEKKDPKPKPKPGTTSRPLKDDPIERLKKRQAKRGKRNVDWSTNITTNDVKKHWKFGTPENREREPDKYHPM